MTQSIKTLIERLEQASGPDRELDFWCWWYGYSTESKKKNPAPPPEDYVRRNLKHNGAPRYTDSIDSALTLVPENHWWTLDGEDGAGAVERPGALVAHFTVRDVRMRVSAATPAIALCIAALKSREAQT